MVSTHELLAIARQIKLARDGVQQVAPITSRRPDFDLRAAYVVMQLDHEARLRDGAMAVGRKIGFTNPAMWDICGVREPIWSYVYDKTLDRTPDGNFICRIDKFCEPRIEPEIVFHFRAKPPDGADGQTVMECVDWIAHAFEIVQSHFPDWKFQAADTVADGGLHARLLLGKALPVRGASPELMAALSSFSVELSCDGEVRELGRGANVMGSPLAAILHLMATLAKQEAGVALQANELVSTGTITTAHPVHAGEVWRSQLSGIALPGLTVRFEA